MTSILTNNGAIVALQTLKMTNKHLNVTQSQIATGKVINTPADGSAIWAVAKTMETDRDAFKTIQNGLNVAAKVVSTAVENSNGIVDDLNTIKQRLSSSSNSDQDVKKNWNEIKELIDGIQAKISGSQINGVNLLNKDGTGAGVGKPYQVLSSLDRSYGQATTKHSTIEVESVDLQTAVLDVLRTWTEPKTSGEAKALISGAAPSSSDYAADFKEYADLKALTGGAITPKVTADIAKLESKYTVGAVTGASILGTEIKATAAAAGVEAKTFEENFKDKYKAELPKETDSIESLISIAIERTATLGAKQHRIESQAETVGKIADNLTVGIGAMVDADLEEASARLQALQAQQQLGIQALSIANQAPQSILSLFR